MEANITNNTGIGDDIMMSNITTSEIFDGVSDLQLLMVKIFCIYNSVLGTIGNGLTIVAILKAGLHHQSPFLKILNLSLCNILHCVIFLPILSLHAFVGLWDTNSMLCKLYSFGLYSMMGTELLGCLCITLNRYFCVVHHRVYETIYNTRTKLFLQWVCTWLIYPVILALPLFNVWSHYDFYPQKLICHPFPGQGCTGYCLFVFIPTLITFPVIAYCYIHIIYMYFTVQRNLKLSRDSPSESSQTSQNSLYRAHDHHRTRAELKMAFTILAVLLVYGVCRVPFLFLYLYDPSMTLIEPYIHTLIIYAGTNANWINPLIYAYTNKQIRKSLRNILTIRK